MKKRLLTLAASAAIALAAAIPASAGDRLNLWLVLGGSHARFK